MSKKHFIALADAIRNMNTHDDGESLEFSEVVFALANFCQAQNPRFNRQRWIDLYRGRMRSQWRQAQVNTLLLIMAVYLLLYALYAVFAVSVLYLIVKVVKFMWLN